ncbi:MAG TPA: FG-GAP-like repeat-containing protein, partial [Polyangiaceae bacterium]|nr:FG-GAP-like repeat-containing protein [Polyangiaceae bacterium]
MRRAVRMDAVTLRGSRWGAMILLGFAGGCEGLIGASFEGAHSVAAESQGDAGAAPDLGGRSGRDDASGGAEAGSISSAGDHANGGASAGEGGQVESAGGRAEATGGRAQATGGHAQATGGLAGVNTGGTGGKLNDCSAGVAFHDLAFSPEDEPVPVAFEREIPAEVVAPGIGIAIGVSPPCIGAKISTDKLLFADCNAQQNQKVRVVEGGKTGALTFADHPISAPEEQIRFSILNLNPWGENRPVAWSMRSPQPGEPVTLFGWDKDRIRVAHTTLQPAAFEGPVECDGCPRPGQETPMMLAFGGDARLVAFCKLNACGGVSDCLAIEGTRSWDKLSPFATQQGLFFSDLDGDGKADALAVARKQLRARLAGTSQFLELREWFAGEASGDAANALGDVTGDRRADFISIGNGISIYPAIGDEFGAARLLSAASTSALGARVGDVDGEGSGEVVIWQPRKILVIRDANTPLPRFETWYGALPAGVDNLDVRDVNGDGRADLVLGFADHVAVLPSTGSAFAEPEDWLTVDTTPPGWFFADVTGDGRADAIQIDLRGAGVYRSTGSAFVHEDTFRTLPIGERGNYFADV